METVVHYVPMRREFPSRHGLSERELRRRLEKQGWQVWRGGLLHTSWDFESWPNVLRKYDELRGLLERHAPGKLEELQYLSSVHHGMPDFICFRDGAFKFVECKLGHEALSVRQRKCIPKLQDLGFMVEVHKLVPGESRPRRARVELGSRRKVVVEKQMRLTRRWPKGRRRGKSF